MFSYGSGSLSLGERLRLELGLAITLAFSLLVKVYWQQSQQFQSQKSSQFSLTKVPHFSLKIQNILCLMLLQKHKVILLLWLVVTLHNSRLDQSSSSRSSGPHNGSITSSSQSSDESEDPSVSHNSIRNQRRQRGHYQQATGSYRSSSLPRHSSVSQYRRSITMPNIKSQMEPGSVSSYNNNSTLIGQIEPIRPPGPPPSHNNVQLTTWLQSLTGEDPYIRFHFIN